MKVKLILSLATRATFVAALMAYGMPDLARALAAVEPFDPADDGPEVDLLLRHSPWQKTNL